jgi:hypothetical protein
MNSKSHFHIDSWAAWAPGVSSHDDWRAYFANTLAINPEDKADVAFLPAMQRRRLSPLARAAFYVTEQIMSSAEACPSIFCSTYGETQRTYGILEDIAKQQEISPTAFSLSVHNAISGQFTIFFDNKHPTSAMAPSERDYLLPIADALAQLNEKASSVLLVYYEEALPEFYQPYAKSTEFPCALAFRISLANDTNKPSYQLTFNADDNEVSSTSNMPILQFIQSLASSHSTRIGNWTLAPQ